MALSWIFGKKKEDRPIPVTVEAVEVGSDEDYTIIQARHNHTGVYPQVPVSPYPPVQSYTPLPYSVLPQRQNDQPVENITRPSVQSQLEGVPFLLAPSLEKNPSMNHATGLEDLRRAVFQIAADINDTMFEYDFKLERSIIRETSVYDKDN